MPLGHAYLTEGAFPQPKRTQQLYGPFVSPREV